MVSQPVMLGMVSVECRGEQGVVVMYVSCMIQTYTTKRNVHDQSQITPSAPCLCTCVSIGTSPSIIHVRSRMKKWKQPQNKM